MSDAPERFVSAGVVDVDVNAWVEKASDNPVLYRDRQVAEIVLTAIGLAPHLSETLVLKGGTLMALAFDSIRQTSDIDFTATEEPEGFEIKLKDELDVLLPKAAVELGYLDLVCKVQKIEKRPRPQNFEGHKFPALHVRVGSAKRGTPEEERLNRNQSPRVLDLEISFRDQVYSSQLLNLSQAGVTIKAFTIHEMIAEKLRALLQQPGRNRYRRQDVYDLAFLVKDHYLSNDDKAVILTTLEEKCRLREVPFGRGALEDPEVIRRAESDWKTLAVEIGQVPPFADCFEEVATFYGSLPWPESQTPV